MEDTIDSFYQTGNKNDANTQETTYCNLDELSITSESLSSSPLQSLPPAAAVDIHDRNLYGLLVEWGFPEMYNKIWFGKNIC